MNRNVLSRLGSVFSVFFVLLLFYSCSTLNRAVIEGEARTFFEPLVLVPDYDIFAIRVDVIRQTEEEKIDEKTSETEDVSYHPVGFYLGNGLFMDLNDNLSFVVPGLLDINDHQNFVITEDHEGFLINRKTTYELRNNRFTVKRGGLFDIYLEQEIDERGPITSVRGGLFSKYDIEKSDSTLSYQTLLGKTTLHKSQEGYYYKTLFGKKEYRQIDNEIHIGHRYIIRHKGDQIEIRAKGLFNEDYLIYRIVKIGRSIFVFDKDYRGLEIRIHDDQIQVKRNQDDSSRFSVTL